MAEGKSENRAAYPMLGRHVVPDMPGAEDLLPWLRRIDAGRWYSNFGPLVTEFEQRLAAHLKACDTRRAEPLALVTLASCYHALQMGLQLLRLPADAKVLIPAVTFPACPLAVSHAGARPVLADVDRDTWQLTPAIARRIATKTEIHAVMPVALYGIPAPAEEWDRFVEDTGIPVVIDAAAALEVQSIPRRCLVAHSLHATKPFGIGEGGLLAARNPVLIEEARRMANFGMHERIAVRDGCNAKLSEYHGAVALAQLERWQGVKQRRRDIFQRYHKAITKAGLPLDFQRGAEDHVIGSLMLKAEEPAAGKIAAELNGHGICAHRMYLPPLYHHPHFGGLAAVNGEGRMSPSGAPLEQKTALMENSELMQRKIFGLPFHAFLDGRDIDFVAGALTAAMERVRHPAGRTAKNATA